MKKILIVDDDSALREGLVENLRLEGWMVDSAPDAATALEKIAGANVLVTDIRLPDMDGLDLLVEAQKRRSDLEIIVMTGYASIPSAVEAMRRGARTYLSKPFDPEELILHIRDIARNFRLREAASLAGRGDLAGISAVMKHVFSQVDAAANSSAPVLITGETGTGKECAARAVHDLSAARRAAFVPVNLGALPRDLIESELFGHERGAFTGAHARKKGRFLLAHQGTLFLDEVDSLPLDLQPKLLRAIETREVWPLGGEAAIKTDVRIIAATNSRVEDLVAAQKFREDLYYRLNVLRIELPPLRDRPEDIPGLVRILLDRMQRRGEGYVEITGDALSRMMTKRWAGNVRELANALERGLARAQSRGEARIKIGADDVDSDPNSTVSPEISFRLAKDQAVEKWTRSTLTSALAQSNGNVSEAAKKLQMNRTFLLSLIKKYRIRE